MSPKRVMPATANVKMMSMKRRATFAMLFMAR